MSYKTILVHVDESEHLKARVDMAAKIAMIEGAHLIGVATTGVTRFIHDTMTVHPDGPAAAPYLATLRGRADAALNTFEAVVRQAGVTSFEKRSIDVKAAEGITLQARYCDLVVLGQNDPDEVSPVLTSGFQEEVVMSSGSPTLIVPNADGFKTIGDNIMIAWNASAEAMRAVRSALPLLRRASSVTVAIFNSTQQPDLYGEEPGADIALFLSRHGVKVEVVKQDVGSNADVGKALLSLAATSRSDLLVMGCYGHSRVREVVLGGATRDILKSMTIPVLMAH